jgi:hypothetical protein
MESSSGCDPPKPEPDLEPGAMDNIRPDPSESVLDKKAENRDCLQAGKPRWSDYTENRRNQGELEPNPDRDPQNGAS